MVETTFWWGFEGLGGEGEAGQCSPRRGWGGGGGVPVHDESHDRAASTAGLSSGLSLQNGPLP